MNRLEIRGQSCSYRFYWLDAPTGKMLTDFGADIEDFVDDGGLNDLCPEYFTGLTSWPTLSVNDVWSSLQVPKRLGHRFSSISESKLIEPGQSLLVNEQLTEGLQCRWDLDSSVKFRALKFDVDVFRFPDGTKSVLLSPTYDGIEAEICGENVVSSQWRLYDLSAKSDVWRA